MVMCATPKTGRHPDPHPPLPGTHEWTRGPAAASRCRRSRTRVWGRRRRPRRRAAGHASPGRGPGEGEGEGWGRGFSGGCGFGVGVRVAAFFPCLHDERVRPAVAPAAKQARHDHRVRRGRAQAAGPPLGGGQGRGVEHERVGRRVKRRGRLEAAHVRPVPELGLGVRPDEAQGEGVGEPLGLLLGVGLRGGGGWWGGVGVGGFTAGVLLLRLRARSTRRLARARLFTPLARAPPPPPPRACDMRVGMNMPRWSSKPEGRLTSLRARRASSYESAPDRAASNTPSAASSPATYSSCRDRNGRFALAPHGWAASQSASSALE